MMTIEITSSPSLDDVLSVANAKAYLRVDHSDDDTLIEALRDAAISWVEDYCNTRLGDVTAVGYMDHFYPARVPVGPVQSISSITYTAPGGSTATLGTGNYWYDLKTMPARIRFDNVPDVEDDALNRVQVNMTIGYLEAEIPKPLIQAVKLMIAHMYETRLPVVTGTITSEVPLALKALLNPYRIL